jgi:predicted CXXCH cytochrome family protein
MRTERAAIAAFVTVHASVARAHVLSLAVLLMAGLGPNCSSAQDVPDYVGSEVCATCHTAEAEAWSGSHHALAWTLPSPTTVLADFENTTFEHNGSTARFRMDDAGRYRVEVTETDGSTRNYPVHSVVGVEPLQQYLLETEPGRLQSFDVVWDTEKGGWFHLYPDQVLPPSDGQHWTGPYKSWNARCAECHSTGYKKSFDPGLQIYTSSQAEIGVGCEACHGPAKAHLDWAEGATPDGKWSGLDPYGFTQDFSGTERTIQQCATCHSRREAHDDASPVPGTTYHDAYSLALLRPGLYQADGQILDEVYEYGSFLQSKMYAKGVGCVDCHNPHSATLVAEGNAVCTQCHSPAGNPNFPSLKLTEYDSPSHHFHETGTDGALCKSCHAVERVYMGNDWRADHSFRIPRPDLSAETGATDACSGCHADRAPDWAAARIAERYPDAANRGPHYGTTLARGRANAALAADDLAAMAADPSRPAIVRATALWLLETSGRPDIAVSLAGLVQDENPLVRDAAAGLMRAAPSQDRVSTLVNAFDDPIRSVRIAAARAFLGAPVARLPGQIRASMENAMAEWRKALGSRLDFPETHLQIAGMALTMRAFPAAAAAFRESLRLDPQQTRAWVMLTQIAAATGGASEARSVLQDALSAVPGDPTLLALQEELSEN